MIAVRPARIVDAASIGGVHVSAWRSAYAGILPTPFLSGLSDVRQAWHYEQSIAEGGVFVAIAEDAEPGVVGFVTVGTARSSGLADGEVHTLYVLDDWRDRGVGRALLAAGAQHLVAAGCRTAFLWVLRDNPGRWFYKRVGGREAGHSTTTVAGTELVQVAYVWDPIERLLPNI